MMKNPFATKSALQEMAASGDAVFLFNATENDKQAWWARMKKTGTRRSIFVTDPHGNSFPDAGPRRRDYYIPAAE